MIWAILIETLVNGGLKRMLTYYAIAVMSLKSLKLRVILPQRIISDRFFKLVKKLTSKSAELCLESSSTAEV